MHHSGLLVGAHAPWPDHGERSSGQADLHPLEAQTTGLVQLWPPPAFAAAAAVVLEGCLPAWKVCGTAGTLVCVGQLHDPHPVKAKDKMSICPYKNVPWFWATTF